MSAPIRVGRYALFDALASGGMATVYLGRLTGAAGFSRTVAVKRLHPNFAKESDFVAMLVDEARLAGRIRHPNVVPTLDVVQLPDELMLVMEYVHGEALSKLLRNVAVAKVHAPVPIASAIMVGALHGLNAAHEATDERGAPLEIIHRDVSPQNILVGVDGNARILDFGVARATGRIQATGDGKLKGKLAYMSPEQLRGDPADRRVDVWAAGVVLWELLTARRLFAAESDVLVIPKVIDGTIEPPSKFADVSAELDAVVLRALERDVSKRYATAYEFAVELERAAAPATSRAVAEWVRDIGGDAFNSRSGVLARVEAWEETSGFAEGARAIASVVGSSGTGSGVSSSPGGIEPGPHSGYTGAYTGAHTVVAAAETPVRKPSRAWIGIAFAAFSTLGVGAFFLLRALIPLPPHGAPSSAGTFTGAATPPAVPSQSATTANTADVALPTLAADAGAADSGAALRGSHLVGPAYHPPAGGRIGAPALPTSSAVPAAAAPATPKLNCDPPYTMGPAPDFIRKPKLECL